MEGWKRGKDGRGEEWEDGEGISHLRVLDRRFVEGVMEQ